MSARSAVRVELAGKENLLKIFRDFPEEAYRKPILAAFTKAAAPVRRAMIGQLPARLKAISKVIKVKAAKSKTPALSVGVFANQGVFRNSRGVDWEPYQIALWHNYGTLDWRASRFYDFKTPVRRKRSTASMTGIRPQLFIEKGWEKSKNEAQRIFEQTADKEITKFFEKEANKLGL